MSASIFTLQYLGDSPSITSLEIPKLVKRLQMAVDRFSFSHLLIGWQLPRPVLEVLRLETERLGMRFLLWQPLLTRVKSLTMDPSSQVEGLTGSKVRGFQDQPDFTFYCPNHPSVPEAIFEKIDSLIQEGIYQGFFLDRVRFPSPTVRPREEFACFCKFCCQKAAENGLDIEKLRKILLEQLQTGNGCVSFVSSLLYRSPGTIKNLQNDILGQFLAFRQRSISEFLARIVQPITDAHLEIGLDSFSPCLTRLVGQDLNLLGRSVDWVKLMTYAHTIAPAGIPYELSGLGRFLTQECRLREEDVLDLLSHSTELPLPTSIRTLEKQGISSLALQMEIERGQAVVSAPVLPGIELVDLPGVTDLDADQIRADILSVKRAGSAGLAVSWDLLHIPMERLELLSEVYFGES